MSLEGRPHRGPLCLGSWWPGSRVPGCCDGAWLAWVCWVFGNDGAWSAWACWVFGNDFPSPASAACSALLGCSVSTACLCVPLCPGSPLAPFRRTAALQEGLRRAVSVPLTLAETVASLWPALQELARCGNLACRSDLQVGGPGGPQVSCCKAGSSCWG